MLVNKKVLSSMKNALQIGMVPENAEAIPLIESVQPVVQVDDLKLTGVMVAVDSIINLQTAGTFVTGYTCPGGKRAYVLMAGKEGTTSISQVQVLIDGVRSNLTPLEIAEGYAWPRFDLWLSAGDEMGLRGSNDAGDTARHLYALIVEVDW